MKIDSFCNPEGKYYISRLVGGRKTRDNQVPDIFYERTTLVTSDFKWVHLSVFINFSRFFFHDFGTNFIGFERTGDHNTPANKLGFNLHQINKGR